MNWQHCGRMNDHLEHDVVARKRIVVESCTCDSNPCICPEIPADLQRSGRKEKFRCPGKLQTEGAPANMPVEVNL